MTPLGRVGRQPYLKFCANLVYMYSSIDVFCVEISQSMCVAFGVEREGKRGAFSAGY
jgi:hypothetical protein